MVVGGIVLMMAAGLFAVTRFLGGELAPVNVGAVAPAFSARTVDPAPTTRTLEAYRGKVVLLNLWATWCLPCRREMPSIEALYREFGPKGLAVVAVSIDDPGAEEAIREFVTAYGLTFDILYDPTGAITRTYQTTGVPETFVIGRDGKIRKKQIAAHDWSSEANRALIAQLLEEDAR
jgi:peroxiredoxin